MWGVNTLLLPLVGLMQCNCTTHGLDHLQNFHFTVYWLVRAENYTVVDNVIDLTSRGYSVATVSPCRCPLWGNPHKLAWIGLASQLPMLLTNAFKVVSITSFRAPRLLLSHSLLVFSRTMVWTEIVDNATGEMSTRSSSTSQSEAANAASQLDHMCALDITSRASFIRLSGIICTIGELPGVSYE
ncbi:hypothetical protein J6590_084458 [Homalodisca vitripennis]|nr:hypothetical protein J6590_084458 [Homalodisca vitripennis]